MSRFEMSEEAQKILEFIATSPLEFTYDQIRALTGVNDVTRLRGYLMTAMRRMRKRGVWYASVRGIGYRRLTEDGKNPAQAEGLNKVKRKINRLDRDQDAIHFEGLSRDGKMAFSFNASRIGGLKAAASLKRQREIKRKVENGDLPVRKNK